MTSKQRAYLKSLAMKLDPVLNIGKDNLTPEFTEAVREAFNGSELIKIGLLKTVTIDINEAAEIISERTGAVVVQTIGRKMVLYRQAKKPEDRKIKLP